MAFTGGSAQAQLSSLAGRFTLHINGGYQAGPRTLTESILFDVYEDTGKFQITQEVRGDLIFDGGGLVTVWNQLAVGATYTELNTSTVVSFQGTVPHPLVSSERTVPSMDFASRYRERATHIHLSLIHI